MKKLIIFFITLLSFGITQGQVKPKVVKVKPKVVKVIFSSVKIGNQTWMNKNLNVSTYRNGDPIPLVTDSAEWAALTTGAYCYYNNDSSYHQENTFGKLYNGYAVHDPRGLAPLGWHIPNNIEWDTLYRQYGRAIRAGAALKEDGILYWKSPNAGVLDYDTFNARGGGGRSQSGEFNSLYYAGWWWSTTSSSASFSGAYRLNYDDTKIISFEPVKRFGYSVRCVKD